MRDGLPSPARKCKFASKLAAQPRFHVVASRFVSPDHLETAVEGDFDGDLEAVKAHARTVATSIAERFDTPALCDVTDADGAPVFSFATSGVIR